MEREKIYQKLTDIFLKFDNWFADFDTEKVNDYINKVFYSRDDVKPSDLIFDDGFQKGSYPYQDTIDDIDTLSRVIEPMLRAGEMIHQQKYGETLKDKYGEKFYTAAVMFCAAEILRRLEIENPDNTDEKAKELVQSMKSLNQQIKKLDDQIENLNAYVDINSFEAIDAFVNDQLKKDKVSFTEAELLENPLLSSLVIYFLLYEKFKPDTANLEDSKKVKIFFKILMKISKMVDNQGSGASNALDIFEYILEGSVSFLEAEYITSTNNANAINVKLIYIFLNMFAIILKSKFDFDIFKADFNDSDSPDSITMESHIKKIIQNPREFRGYFSVFYPFFEFASEASEYVDFLSELISEELAGQAFFGFSTMTIKNFDDLDDITGDKNLDNTSVVNYSGSILKTLLALYFFHKETGISQFDNMAAFVDYVIVEYESFYSADKFLKGLKENKKHYISMLEDVNDNTMKAVFSNVLFEIYSNIKRTNFSEFDWGYVSNPGYIDYFNFVSIKPELYVGKFLPFIRLVYNYLGQADSKIFSILYNGIDFSGQFVDVHDGIKTNDFKLSLDPFDIVNGNNGFMSVSLMVYLFDNYVTPNNKLEGNAIKDLIKFIKEFYQDEYSAEYANELQKAIESQDNRTFFLRYKKMGIDEIINFCRDYPGVSFYDIIMDVDSKEFPKGLHYFIKELKSLLNHAKHPGARKFVEYIDEHLKKNTTELFDLMDVSDKKEAVDSFVKMANAPLRTELSVVFSKTGEADLAFIERDFDFEDDDPKKDAYDDDPIFNKKGLQHKDDILEKYYLNFLTSDMDREAAINYYTTGEYKKLNPILRNSGDGIQPDRDNVTSLKILVKTFEDAPRIPFDVTLWRGSNWPKETEKLQPGKFIVEEAVLSTSVTIDGSFGDPRIKYKILCKKGSVGYYIRPISDVKREYEVILPPGAIFRIYSFSDVSEVPEYIKGGKHSYLVECLYIGNVFDSVIKNCQHFTDDQKSEILRESKEKPNFLQYLKESDEEKKPMEKDSALKDNEVFGPGMQKVLERIKSGQYPINANPVKIKKGKKDEK